MTKIESSSQAQSIRANRIGMRRYVNLHRWAFSQCAELSSKPKKSFYSLTPINADEETNIKACLQMTFSERDGLHRITSFNSMLSGSCDIVTLINRLLTPESTASYRPFKYVFQFWTPKKTRQKNTAKLVKIFTRKYQAKFKLEIFSKFSHRVNNFLQPK